MTFTQSNSIRTFAIVVFGSIIGATLVFSLYYFLVLKRKKEGEELEEKEKQMLLENLKKEIEKSQSTQEMTVKALTEFERTFQEMNAALHDMKTYHALLEIEKDEEIDEHKEQDHSKINEIETEIQELMPEKNKKTKKKATQPITSAIL